MSDHVTFTLKVEGGVTAESHKLAVGVVKLGRVEGNDILLPHNFVSSRHAQLTITENSCTFTDLKSTNGSLLNGQPIAPLIPITVTAATKIQIGPFTLTFHLIAERKVEEIPPPEPTTAPAKAVEGPKPLTPSLPTLQLVETVTPPIGLSYHSSRFLDYLPPIYQTEFMSRFLAIFEATYCPIEWTVDNFDLFLHSRTAPAGFLSWLGTWFDITFDVTWTEKQRREILNEAHYLFAMRGTKWALGRVIEIYTGQRPKINEFTDPNNPHLFLVQMPVTVRELNPELVLRLIDAHKPAQTTYKLQYERG